MIVFPNAKINVGLDIFNKRNDGFHDIISCFVPIDFYDVLELVHQPDLKGIEFSQMGLKLDNKPYDNLVVKAFNLLASDYELPGTKVILQKNIPSGAGLGGGSSDATFMLKALNDLYNLQISDEQLHDYASQLGSDCSFFLYNKPALIKGRGDFFEPLKFDFETFYVVLVVPDIHISTAWAYGNIICRQPAYDLAESLRCRNAWRKTISNDFEIPVFDKYPELKAVKEQLYDMGAFFAGLTGSGSTMFGCFSHKPELPDFGNDYMVRQVQSIV